MTKQSITRERHLEIRWIGDESTERAVLVAIGKQDVADGVAAGVYERWMQIPARQEAEARKALIDSGATLLEPSDRMGDSRSQSSQLIGLDKASWGVGYRAGLADNPQSCPPALDGLSYWSGVIEGKAAREKEFDRETEKIVR